MNCLTKVATGQLVYFELEEGKPINIERASLANFRKEVIDDLLTWKRGSLSDWYYDNTHIIFENLNSVISQKTTSEINDAKDANDNNEYNSFYCDNGDAYDFLYLEDAFAFYEEEENDISISTIKEDINKDLPEKIDELFEYFGKYQHTGNESKSINILDISLWIDAETCKYNCYGEKVDEIKYLYNVFIEKMRIDEKGNTITTERKNNCISKIWKLLLAKSTNQELRIIIQEMPIFQPVLPIRFCKNHLDILSENYGMPSIAICKLYYLYKIKNANTASEYQYLSDRLYTYEHCCTKHLKGEGVPFCKMGKKHIKGLREQLEEQYNTIIKKNIIRGFIIYTLNEGVNLINKIKYNKEQILSLGIFLEVLDSSICLRNNFYFWKFKDCYLQKYDEIPNECQRLLKKTIRKITNRKIIDIANDETITPSSLSYYEHQLSEWIDTDKETEIIQIVNSRFADLDDLSELYNAYIGKYITLKQYYHKYQDLTSDYNIYQLVKELDNSHYNLLPRPIQWNIVSRILKILDYKSLDSYSNVNIGYYESISNVRDLLRWIGNESNLDNIIKEKAKKRILNVLSNEEKWILFEEKIISSPGKEIIRERLDNAYKNDFYLNKKIYRTDCFQEVMYNDILTCEDNKKKLRILDYLYGDYRMEISHHTDKLIQLYFWLKNPYETKDWDWNLILTHFSDFHEREQLLLFRYIFLLIAEKKVNTTIDELYNVFVDSSDSVCSIVRCIIYLLKEKISSPNEPIKSDVFFSIYSNYYFDSLKNFFYICNGYSTFTYSSKESKNLSFMGYVEKQLIDNEFSYVITFYEEPLDFWGKPIEWLSEKEIEIAKSVLEINLNAQIIDDEYVIPLSEINELKKYVLAYNIEDKCNLFNISIYKLYYPYMLYNKKNTPNRDAYLKIYNNKKRSYEKCHNFICCCSNYCDIDPEIGIPFYWCNKKTCTRNCIFIKPVSLWQKFKIADLFYILLGMNKSNIPLIWSIVTELSWFINDFMKLYEEDEYVDFKKNIVESKILDNKNEIVGFWSKNMSIIKEVDDSIDEYYYYDDDDAIYIEEDILDGIFGDYIENDEENDEEKDNNDYEYDDYYESSFEPRTYDRYNGSYAQDVMGYSDDDIDTIFDGDPDAYWNID